MISVVIASRNRYNNLKGTLEALADQTFAKSEYEVILSDDNSSDQTQSLINEYREKLQLKYVFSNLPKPHTWNASIVRNLGALVADRTTQAYLFVDSDVKLPETALLHYREDLDKNSNRVIIGPYFFHREDGTIWPQNNTGDGDVRWKKFSEVTVDETFDTLHDGLACFGGNLLIPRSIFWSVGGFDEDVHIGLEDGSMGIKLWKKNTKFSYDIRVLGNHQWHETPTDRFPSDMSKYVNDLNQKHFHMDTGEVDKSIDLITASKETYASWGIPDWRPPESWLKNE